MSALPKEDEKITLYGLARSHLDDADGNLSVAIDSLTELLLRDRKLLKLLIEQVCREAIRSYTRVAQGNTRFAIIQSISSAARRAQGEALNRATMKLLLDYPLGGGKKLRDATRAEIIHSADVYEKIAQTNGQRAKWLRLIAQSVPDGKCVGDVISEDRAKELFEESAK